MSSPTTTARDRLRDAQAKAGALRARVAELWSAAESGGEVDPAAVTVAEQELSVADRLTPTLTRLAQAEQVAETEAVWAEVETAALAEYQVMSADLLDRLDAARDAVTELATSAEALHAHLDGFTGDPRRPPKLGADGTVQGLLGGWERSTVSGVTMRAPSAVDAVLAVAAEEVEQITGGRGNTPVVEQLRRIRANTTFPTDNRK